MVKTLYNHNMVWFVVVQYRIVNVVKLLPQKDDGYAEAHAYSPHVKFCSCLILS